MKFLPSIIFLLALAPSSVAEPFCQESVTEKVPPPALSIDGQPIAWNEYAQWLLLLQGEGNSEEFISNYLVTQAAQEGGITATNEQLLKSVNESVNVRVERAFNGDRNLWVAELERLGQTPEIYFEERLTPARFEFQIDELVKARRIVTDEQVRDLWESRYGPEGRAMQMSLLFLKISAPAQPQGTSRDENIQLSENAKNETFARANKLLANIREQGNFEEMVQEHSGHAASRAKGGKLEGPLVLTAWPGASREGLRALKVGEVLEPFFGDGGVNLLRLGSFTKTLLADVEASLRDELQNMRADQAETAELIKSLDPLGAAAVTLTEEMNRKVSAEKPRSDRPVFQIHNEPVTRRQYSRWLLARRGRPLIRTFAQHRYTLERAHDVGIVLTSVQIEQRVEEDLGRQIELFFKGDRDAWLTNLANDGKTVSSFMHVARIRTAHNLRAEQIILLDRQVSDEDVKREWQDRYGKDGRAMDLRYIMRRIPEPLEGQLTTEAEINAYIAAKTQQGLEFLSELRQRAQNGEDFAALARTYSEEAESRERGGRPMERVKLHEWPEDLQKMLWALKPGEMTVPVEFGMGSFFLIELAGLVHVPLEEAEAELRADLQKRRPGQVEVSSFLNHATRTMQVKALQGMYY
ncbi:MAG: hypothetical protein ACI8X5_002595 [Planctomycetota bacterium]|jgi:hypothetical protein